MSGTFSDPRNVVQTMVAPAHAANLRDFIGEQLIDLQKYVAAISSLTAQLDADPDVNTTTYATNDPVLTLAETDYFEARNPVEPSLVGDVATLLDNGILTDLTAIKAAIAAITALLDADTGVTDTDYAANNDMGALTVVALTETEIEARSPVEPMLSFASFGEIRDHSVLVVADLAAVRAAIVGITAQLDLDAGITATTFAATSDPAAALVTALTA